MTALLVASPASASAAGGSALHVDPSSPVAKAYALPLGSARGTSTPSGHTKLFGSGIRRASTSSSGLPAASPGRHRRRQHTGAMRTAPPTRTRTTVARLRGRGAPAAYRVLRPSSGSGLLWMGLVVVVVLGLGVGGALALRRSR